MNNTLLAAALTSAALLGGLAGAGIALDQEQKAQEDAWSQVLVVRGETLVANPAALTPRELADAQIIARDPRYIAFCHGDHGARAVVGDDLGEVFDPAHCSEGKSLTLALRDAKRI